MYKKISGLVTGTMLLSATVTAIAQEQLNVNARVRVYQEAEITLYPGAYCYGGENAQMIEAARSIFSIFSTRKRVGMPETDDIEGSYNEYEIEAGKPLTVMLKWEAEKNGIKASCGPLGATFYPQYGHDYDITIGYQGNCYVQVRELVESSPGKAVARLTPTTSSFACSAAFNSKQ